MAGIIGFKDHLLEQLADKLEDDNEASPEQLCLLAIAYSLSAINDQLQQLNDTFLEISRKREP
jgi:hypothetical protein